MVRVYLHSMISGEHLMYPKIHDTVRETIECLQHMPVGTAGTSSSGISSNS